MVYLLPSVFGDDAQTRLFRSMNRDSAGGDGCEPGQMGCMGSLSTQLLPIRLSEQPWRRPWECTRPGKPCWVDVIILPPSLLK